MRRARAIGTAAGGALIVAGLSLAVWLVVHGPSQVIPVEAGARLLGLSRGTLYWLGPTCSVWQARVDDVAEEPTLVLRLDECPPDDPRFVGDVVYHLGGSGRVARYAPGWRQTLFEWTLAYALALDGRYLYVGNCALRGDCRIERLPLDDPDNPPSPTLMQAGILALANMDVDDSELFWVDRGRRKPDCSDPYYGDEPVPVLHCKAPVPPRLMAAPKAEPRADERVVAGDFDGRRPFLGAHHVYWLGAGGVRRVPKTGGSAAELVLATKTLGGFAATPDGAEVFIAADAGIFQARDGDAPRPLQRTASPPRGVAVDARFVYWIDPDANAVVRRRR